MRQAKFSSRGLLLFILLFQSVIAVAKVYVWVDGYGQKHYSDRPRKGAQELSIHPGYSWYTIKRVYDGDTVLLQNGQKIRFSGINTPEVEGRYKSAEPGGEEAKQWLIQRLQGQKIRLETGLEKKDKYGRLVAHVFSEDGGHINLELVRKGLAFVTLHPPNLKYSQALLNAQQQAETALAGIWGRPFYKAKPYSEIKGHYKKGWNRITGVITKIKSTRHNVYLKFSNKFAVKIDREFQDLFPDFKQYLDKKIEVRGWLNKSRYGFNLMIRHPASIRLLNGN